MRVRAPEIPNLSVRNRRRYSSQLIPAGPPEPVKLNPVLAASAKDAETPQVLQKKIEQNRIIALVF
jgi:hypothetical protein